MTIKNTPVMSFGDFEHLLEVYGADRTRWPLAERAAAAACLASNQGARRLLAEAEVLDAVLLTTEEPSNSELGVLADRIVSAARNAPRLATQSGRSVGALTVRKPAAPAPRPISGRDWVRVTALLAASLVIGVFAGQSQLGASALPALENLTSLASARSVDRLAVLDFHIEAVDED